MKSLKVDGHTGIDWIDKQHEELQDVLDKLVIMILENTGKEEVAERFVNFSAMWERHCRSEEAYIKKINFPRLNVMQNEHKRMNTRFAEMEAYYLESPEQFKYSTDLFELRNLVIIHIVDFDTVELKNPHPNK